MIAFESLATNLCSISKYFVSNFVLLHNVFKLNLFEYLCQLARDFETVVMKLQ